MVPRNTAVGGAAALAALFVLAACGGSDAPSDAPSRLLVAVWTDLAIPARLDRIVAVLRQGSEDVRSVRPLDPRGQDQPIVLTLALGYLQRDQPLELSVSGRAGDITMVERRLRFARLAPGDSAVAVALEARCAGLGCEDGWTCAGGRCERSDVAPEALAGSVDRLPPDPLGLLVEGRRIDGCATDEDCEDGDPCTIDECAAHQCASEDLGPLCQLCSSDADCVVLEPPPCMFWFCDPYGVCKTAAVRPGTRCDTDDDPCTVECCREGTICMMFHVCDDAGTATGCDPLP